MGDLGIFMLFGLLAGLFCGMFPMIFGAAKQQMGLAVGGFLACAAAGTLMGLIAAIPVAGVFVYLIAKASKV